MAETNTIRLKTYKRESASVLMVFWAGMTVWGVFDPEAQKASEFMALFVFTAWMGAFGLDSLSKQFSGGARNG